jgi:hypothetical protein
VNTPYIILLFFCKWRGEGDFSILMMAAEDEEE